MEGEATLGAGGLGAVFRWRHTSIVPQDLADSFGALFFA
jgi:hypothetical protein